MTQKRKTKRRLRGGATHPCPKCGQPSAVLVTRREAGVVKRRRECVACHVVFLTEERVAEAVRARLREGPRRARRNVGEVKR